MSKKVQPTLAYVKYSAEVTKLSAGGEQNKIYVFTKGMPIFMKKNLAIRAITRSCFALEFFLIPILKTYFPKIPEVIILHYPKASYKNPPLGDNDIDNITFLNTES